VQDFSSSQYCFLRSSQYRLLNGIQIHSKCQVALRSRGILGGALLASNQITEAIAHLTAAATARPEYFDAHYNLGIAQATAGNFPAAAQELTTAVKLKPDDAGAEANLGAAFAELGETQKAIRHLNRALQLDPGNTLAKENLEALRGAAPQR
jgi:Flp pilus assembly protein TadD